MSGITSVVLAALAIGALVAYLGFLLTRQIDRALRRGFSELRPEDGEKTRQEIVAISRQATRDSSMLEEMLNRLPGRVLDSITNSTNSSKGKLGELIAYLSIRAAYDRIIPVGDIVDFIGVRLPKAGQVGEVVFIEVKSGDSARLRKDQVLFKKLIQGKQVSFVELRIEADAPAAPSQETPRCSEARGD